jgi:hypothetical protein
LAGSQQQKDRPYIVEGDVSIDNHMPAVVRRSLIGCERKKQLR